MLETLGRGASVVYKARDKRSGQVVAIKILTKPDAYIRNKFENEMRVLPKRLAGHPHIVQVYGGGYDEKTRMPYLVMEYMVGGILRDHMQRSQPLPFGQVVSIAGQVCDALQYAHSKGIFHRDLKPENIFFNEQGAVKLGDFGIARLAQSVTVTSSGFLIGTPLYMSYEQAKGVSDLDGRSDLYSLGVVLYEMVTGYPPFVADTPLAIVDKHLMAQPVPPSTVNPAVPAHIETVIMQALKKDKSLRYSTAEQMARALGYTQPMHALEQRSPVRPSTRQFRLRRSDGFEIQLDGQSSLSLGRGSVNPEDPRISRQHAKIFIREDQAWIEDVGSANGTFVNDQRVVQPTPVQHGDRLKLGSTLISIVDD